MDDDIAGGAAAPRREYRATELAEVAGISARTLRFYRERGLLPAPRRAGRLAWYNDQHLARLRTITALLARGHTLSGIAELITAFRAGRDAGRTAELLGLAEPWAEEEPVRLTLEELAASFHAGENAEQDAENLATALASGYIAADGEEVVHVSRGLLEASSAMVAAGIPLSALLAAGQRLREHADALAAVFVELLRAHVAPDVLGERAPERGPLSAEDIKRLTGAVERLRPLAKHAMQAEVSLAMDRRLRAELAGRRGTGAGAAPAS